jgi:hypothetical protein
MNVRAEINMSNSADASHAAARSEHRTTICQNLNRRAENAERTIGAVTYDRRVRRRVEKKCGYSIMAMNVRFL